MRRAIFQREACGYIPITQLVGEVFPDNPRTEKGAPLYDYIEKIRIFFSYKQK
ncbi:MAG: hypothetical protein M0R30_04185 [Methanoregula sp.]|uniref:hypothetical protein n=1 Tax=Methanoregula sp. TaxID=2052170 RepID=UPI0025D40652|nr:hypothetical protein [Methanoregula sp.]MCK9630819.1 hypothetical protein [Methanoregula sp.]